MKSLAASLVVALALAACAPPPPPRAAAPVDRELDRNAAVASARADAAATFRLAATDVTAVRQGGFWVVELRAERGVVRYAISAHDGSIRERTALQ